MWCKLYTVPLLEHAFNFGANPTCKGLTKVDAWQAHKLAAWEGLYCRCTKIDVVCAIAKQAQTCSQEDERASRHQSAETEQCLSF